MVVAAAAARGEEADPGPAPPVPAPGDSVFTEEAVKGLLFGSEEANVEIHGFVNLEYSAFQGDPAYPSNSFDIHNVFLSTKARVGPSVSLFAELEYEHGSEVKLDRAFIDFQILPVLALRLGRFSSPLSYERIHYAAPVRVLTSRPYSVDLAFHEWVDTGVELYGRAGWLGYSLALVNGPRGLTERGVPQLDVVDDNQNKTVVGRVNVYPAPFLETGVAASAGAYDPDGKRWFYLAEVDARLRRGPLDLWAEADYRAGDDEPCSADADAGCNPSYAGDHAAKLGYYALASYAVVQGAPWAHYLKPVARYDEIRDLAAGTGKRRVAVGLNWSPYSHVLLKSEVQMTFAIGRETSSSYGAMVSAVADF
jgi:hypothetical protein